MLLLPSSVRVFANRSQKKNNNNNRIRLFYVFVGSFVHGMQHTRSHCQMRKPNGMNPISHVILRIFFFVKLRSFSFVCKFHFCRWLFGLFGFSSVLMAMARFVACSMSYSHSIYASVSVPLADSQFSCARQCYKIIWFSRMKFSDTRSRRCVVRPRGLNVSLASVFFLLWFCVQIYTKSYASQLEAFCCRHRPFQKERTEPHQKEQRTAYRGHIILITCSHQMRQL